MADDPGSLRRFLKTVIRPAIYGRCAPLEVSAHHLDGEPIPAIEAVQRPFTPFEVGDAWGGTWDTTWFRFRDRSRTRGSGPKWWPSSTSAVTRWSASRPKARSGTPGSDPSRDSTTSTANSCSLVEAQGDEPVEFFVEAAANPIPPWHLADWPLLLPDYSGAPLYTLETAELAVADRSVEGLFLDMRILVELAALDPDRSEQIIAGARQGKEHHRP